MKKIRNICYLLLATCSLLCSAQEVKVMSFNIRFDNPKDTGIVSWQSRRPACEKMMNTISPDVVGMQEPRGETQISDIKKMMHGYSYYEITDAPGCNINKAGRIMVFWNKKKFKATESGHFWLNENPELPAPSFCTTDRNNIRAAIWVRLKVKESGRELFFVTTHTPYKKDSLDDVARAMCAEVIVNRMKQIAGEDATVFVTGDLNATFTLGNKHRNSLLPFYKWMLDSRIMSPATDSKDSFNGFSNQVYDNPRVLDYIFYRNATPISFQTLNEPIWGVPFVSDHYPVICNFEL